MRAIPLRAKQHCISRRALYRLIGLHFISTLFSAVAYYYLWQSISSMLVSFATFKTAELLLFILFLTSANWLDFMANMHEEELIKFVENSKKADSGLYLYNLQQVVKSYTALISYMFVCSLLLGQTALYMGICIAMWQLIHRCVLAESRALKVKSLFGIQYLSIRSLRRKFLHTERERMPVPLRMERTIRWTLVMMVGYLLGNILRYTLNLSTLKPHGLFLLFVGASSLIIMAASLQLSRSEWRSC